MNKRSFLNTDWFLVVPVFILVAISLVTLLSLNFSFFKSQLIYLIISIFAFLFFSQADHKALILYGKPIYIISIVLLILILFLGIESGGAIRWIEIFGFRFQFSEILKPFLAISLTGFLVAQKKYNFRSLFEIILFLTPVALLIFLQPDLGDALIYVAVVFAILLYVGFPFKYFISLILPLIIAVPFFWNFLHDYQRQRILTFLNPGSDPLGTSYNVIQSVIAVGSGMFAGRGLGQGTQSGLRFLPERNTDFIFATISEQLGIIGSVIVLICFIFIIYRIYIIFQKSDDKFCKIFAAIVFFNFLIQPFVNIGMNIGILPIVGVTLPFISSGGSSLLSNFIFLGFLSSISRSSKTNDVLEIR